MTATQMSNLVEQELMQVTLHQEIPFTRRKIGEGSNLLTLSTSGILSNKIMVKGR